MAPVSKPSEGEYDVIVIGGGSAGSASSVRHLPTSHYRRASTSSMTHDKFTLRSETAAGSQVWGKSCCCGVHGTFGRYMRQRGMRAEEGMLP